MLWLVVSFVMQKVSGDEANVAVDKLESETIAPMNKSVIDHDRRIIRLEEKISAIPTQRDFQTLENTVSELGGDIKELTAENRALHGLVERIERSVNVMNEALLTRSNAT